MRRTLKAILGCNLSLLCFLLVLCLPPAYAANLTLEWDANSEPELDHYEVFSREEGQSYDYDNPAWQGTSTVHTFIGLDDDITYCFVVRAVSLVGAVAVKSSNSREVCVLGSNDLDPGYDRGWAISSGDLKGFKLFYNEPVNINDDKLTLGPSSDIPPILTANGVGLPLNLQPPTAPGAGFFSPVKIFIPCPGYSDVSGLQIYYWDGTDWSLADFAWMVPGSRLNHNNGNPSTIEIQVYHFSGAQAGTTSSSSSSGGGGGGCFIAAVMK